MAWGKEWPVKAQGWPEIKPEELSKPVKIDKKFNWTQEQITKDWADAVKNKIPTHDPYTNPGAFLYYECDCGERLDPHTKRFAELNNAAMNSGWKVRWGSQHYIPYCPKCGKDVE